MAYKKNIPLATDAFSTSQVDISDNFGELNTTFDINHVTFDDSTGDEGKHKFTTFVNLTDKSIADPTTSAQELAIFVKDVFGTPRLHYRDPSSGTSHQWSGNITATLPGEAPIAGGLGMKWGEINVQPGAGGTTFTYTVAGLTAYGTNTYALVLTPYSNSGGTWHVTTRDAFGFNAVHDLPGSAFFSFIAIGI